MAGTLRLSNTGTGNGQSTITTAASGDTTYTLPSGGGTFVTTSSTEALTVPFASGTVSAPSITFLGDTNTGIYSPGADQIAITTSGTAAVTVDSSGRLLVGTSSARSNFFNTTNIFPRIQSEGTDISSSALSITLNTADDASGSGLVLARSRGSAVGSYTLVGNNAPLGAIYFQGADGTDFVEGARIQALVDGTPGADDMPGRLVFSTTADGASSPTERMRIASNGRIDTFSSIAGIVSYTSAAAGTSVSTFVGAHSSTGVQSGTNSFVVFSNGDVVNTNNSYGPISSDERLKQDITDANSQWDDIKNIRITNFHYKNDPAGPLQLGPVAQELEQVSPGLITRRPASEDEIADLSNGLVDGDEVLSFKASVLYMKAVKALQEAMERIETLEAEVAALKTS